MKYQIFGGLVHFIDPCLCSCDNGAKKQLMNSVMVVVPKMSGAIDSGENSLPLQVKLYLQI